MTENERTQRLKAFDSYQSFLEGWALFNDGEILRLDEPSATDLPELENQDEPIFESDEAAIEFVRRKAEEGSEYHKEALLLHRKEDLNFGF
ncbi:MAG TPA: hypothetical protein PLP33_29235 [Leptospiraceae bacterium]|nr:hypothetical protein [Leptospiraceae bacterium]